MKTFNQKWGIDDVSDFNDVASQIWEDFLAGFKGNNKLIRPVEEGDTVDDGIDFVYTTKGQRLAERCRDRLLAVGAAHFPDDSEDGYLEISTPYFQES